MSPSLLWRLIVASTRMVACCTRIYQTRSASLRIYVNEFMTRAVLIYVGRLILRVGEAAYEVRVDDLTCSPSSNSFLERCPEVLLFVVLKLDPLADFC